MRSAANNRSGHATLLSEMSVRLHQTKETCVSTSKTPSKSHWNTIAKLNCSTGSKLSFFELSSKDCFFTWWNWVSSFVLATFTLIWSLPSPLKQRDNLSQHFGSVHVQTYEVRRENDRGAFTRQIQSLLWRMDWRIDSLSGMFSIFSLEKVLRRPYWDCHTWRISISWLLLKTMTV